jgi:hypothetical protein
MIWVSKKIGTLLSTPKTDKIRVKRMLSPQLKTRRSRRIARLGAEPVQPTANRQRKQVMRALGVVSSREALSDQSHEEYAKLFSQSLFGETTGLRTNIHKSSIALIQCSATDIETIQAQLPCRIEAFPIKYLGLPLSS